MGDHSRKYISFLTVTLLVISGTFVVYHTEALGMSLRDRIFVQNGSLGRMCPPLFLYARMAHVDLHFGPSCLLMYEGHQESIVSPVSSATSTTTGTSTVEMATTTQATSTEETSSTTETTSPDITATVIVE